MQSRIGAVMAALLACAVSAPGARADMADSFRNPPDSAKPQVWWHWMAGNVTREGITADLEAMADVGIGGAMLFDAGLGARWGVPEGQLVFNTPEWYEMVKFAATEAKRLLNLAGMNLGKEVYEDSDSLQYMCVRRMSPGPSSGSVNPGTTIDNRT